MEKKVSPKCLYIFVSFFKQTRTERVQVRRSQAEHPWLIRTASAASWLKGHSRRSPEQTAA